LGVLTDVAPDGSPVEVYLRLPAQGEPKLIHGAVPRGSAILELGCGTGRITHELIALGHTVVAVDESAEMLAHVRGAEVVQSRVEDLDLGRMFDAVVLASHFVNEPGAGLRTALLRTCRRHVVPGGAVLIECYEPGFDWDDAIGRPRVLGDVRVEVVDAKRHDSLVDAVVEYTVEGRSWTQSFTAAMLDEEELRAALAAADLAFSRWLDRDRGWLEARPCQTAHA
jgi:SAM-dependent methyltransferase